MTTTCPQCGSRERDPRHVLSTDSNRLYLCKDSWHVEGVAAPLEPSPPNIDELAKAYAESHLINDWEKKLIGALLGDFGKQAAAAVSKNLQDELWHFRDKEAESNWKLNQRILELEKEIAALRKAVG